MDKVDLPKRIRPTIRHTVKMTSEQVHDAFRAELRSGIHDIEGQSLPGFVTIYPLLKHQHFWSPQLTLTFLDTEEGCLIRGLYGPKPAIWTMFIFFYVIVGFSAFIILMYGLSLRMLNENADILWLVPLLLLVFSTLWLAAYAGQKKGHRQLDTLHSFLERCVGEKVDLI